MNADGISELAKLFKERDNDIYSGPVVGVVMSPPPEIKIQIDKNIILSKKNLVISAHVMKDYERRIIIEGEKIKFFQVDPPYIGTTHVAANHSHTIRDISIDTNVRIEATNDSAYIRTTDTLVTGDKVILMPSQDQQLYFLVDKAVILE